MTGSSSPISSPSTIPCNSHGLGLAKRKALMQAWEHFLTRE